MTNTESRRDVLNNLAALGPCWRCRSCSPGATVLFDILDGAFMNFARRAFAKPVRKVYCDPVITGLSNGA
jgi:hypothetical protein